MIHVQIVSLVVYPSPLGSEVISMQTGSRQDDVIAKRHEKYGLKKCILYDCLQQLLKLCYRTVRYITVRYRTVRYRTDRYRTDRYRTVRYITVRYKTTV